LPVRRSAGLALAAILALAAALRLTGLRYGLPYPLLNPDEGNIVPRAWAMVHGGGLDPGWYDYPSLLLYVLAPFQAWQAEPSYLTARLVEVALALAGVAAAWWLGLRAYGTRAAVTAAAAVAVATTHVAYSHVAVTDVPLALGVACALALAVSGRLEWAGLTAGLAASAKYPGVFLAVPLVVLGWGRWRRLGASLALAAGAFALTSPFLLVHAGAAWDAASRVQRLARQGWLGFEHDRAAPLAFLDRLWGGLGPALVVAGAGLAVALARRSRADLALVSFALVYFADLLTLHAHFDRYVLPLVPVLGVLAGRTRALAPLALAALVVPLAWSIGDVRELTRTDTRVAALPRIERLVPAGARVAADPSTPPLAGRDVVRLELPGPGRAFDPRRDVDRLRAEGVEWVLVTGAVTDRVLAARDRYPRESGFYDDLARSAREVLRVEPGGGLAGPWVALYRLDSAR
jgi:4-amino-4-deoxy-L-arabinose transferase-like glycosyltransferase